MLKIELLKFISFTLLSFLTSLSLAEEISSWDQLIRKGDIFFKKSDNLPFSGLLQSYYPSGQISLIDNFKNGKQHGDFISFHENGNVSMSGNFKNGKQHGWWSEYHPNGSIFWKLEYIEGVEQDGLFRMFHDNGKISSEVTYKDGKPISNWVHFDNSGKKSKIEYYENGKFFYEEHLD